jgi:hypothetical protein
MHVSLPKDWNVKVCKIYQIRIMFICRKQSMLSIARCACSYLGDCPFTGLILARDDPALTRSDCLSDPVQAKSCRIILHTQQHGMKIAQDDHAFLAVV